MTEEQLLETQAALEQPEGSEVVETMLPEGEADAPETGEQPKDDKATEPAQPAEDVEAMKREIAHLKEKNERLAGKFGEVKGTKQILAKVAKWTAEKGYWDEAEAAKDLGFQPERLRGVINNSDAPDDAIQAQVQAFNRMYFENGIKATLDDMVGEDTLQYVDAFKRQAAIDADLAEEFADTPAEKLPALVVKRGKEIVGKYGSTGLKGYVAKLEAELAALKGQGAAPQTAQKQASTQPKPAAIVPPAAAYADSSDWKKRLLNPN